MTSHHQVGLLTHTPKEQLPWWTDGKNVACRACIGATLLSVVGLAVLAANAWSLYNFDYDIKVATIIDACSDTRNPIGLTASVTTASRIPVSVLASESRVLYNDEVIMRVNSPAFSFAQGTTELDLTMDLIFEDLDVITELARQFFVEEDAYIPIELQADITGSALGITYTYPYSEVYSYGYENPADRPPDDGADVYEFTAMNFEENSLEAARVAVEMLLFQLAEYPVDFVMNIPQLYMDMTTHGQFMGNVSITPWTLAFGANNVSAEALFVEENLTPIQEFTQQYLDSANVTFAMTGSRDAPNFDSCWLQRLLSEFPVPISLVDDTPPIGNSTVRGVGSDTPVSPLRASPYARRRKSHTWFGPRPRNVVRQSGTVEEENLPTLRLSELHYGITTATSLQWSMDFTLRASFVGSLELPVFNLGVSANSVQIFTVKVNPDLRDGGVTLGLDVDMEVADIAQLGSVLTDAYNGDYVQVGVGAAVSNDPGDPGVTNFIARVLEAVDFGVDINAVVPEPEPEEEEEIEEDNGYFTITSIDILGANEGAVWMEITIIPSGSPTLLGRFPLIRLELSQPGNPNPLAEVTLEADDFAFQPGPAYTISVSVKVSPADFRELANTALQGDPIEIRVTGGNGPAANAITDILKDFVADLAITPEGPGKVTDDSIFPALELAIMDSGTTYFEVQARIELGLPIPVPIHLGVVDFDLEWKEKVLGRLWMGSNEEPLVLQPGDNNLIINFRIDYTEVPPLGASYLGIRAVLEEFLGKVALGEELGANVALVGTIGDLNWPYGLMTVEYSFELPASPGGDSGDFLRCFEMGSLQPNVWNILTGECDISAPVTVYMSQGLPFDITVESLDLEVYFDDANGVPALFYPPKYNQLLTELHEPSCLSGQSGCSPPPVGGLPLVLREGETVENPVQSTVIGSVNSYEVCFRAGDEWLFHELVVDIRNGRAVVRLNNFLVGLDFEILGLSTSGDGEEVDCAAEFGGVPVRSVRGATGGSGRSDGAVPGVMRGKPTYPKHLVN